eukprot:3679097-Amphidinium_carterae.1
MFGPKVRKTLSKRPNVCIQLPAECADAEEPQGHVEVGSKDVHGPAYADSSASKHKGHALHAHNRRSIDKEDHLPYVRVKSRGCIVALDFLPFGKSDFGRRDFARLARMRCSEDAVPRTEFTACRSRSRNTLPRIHPNLLAPRADCLDDIRGVAVQRLGSPTQSQFSKMAIY